MLSVGCQSLQSGERMIGMIIDTDQLMGQAEGADDFSVGTGQGSNSHGYRITAESSKIRVLQEPPEYGAEGNPTDRSGLPEPPAPVLNPPGGRPNRQYKAEPE